MYVSDILLSCVVLLKTVSIMFWLFTQSAPVTYHVHLSITLMHLSREFENMMSWIFLIVYQKKL